MRKYRPLEGTSERNRWEMVNLDQQGNYLASGATLGPRT